MRNLQVKGRNTETADNDDRTVNVGSSGYGTHQHWIEIVGGIKSHYTYLDDTAALAIVNTLLIQLKTGLQITQETIEKTVTETKWTAYEE